MCASAAMYRPSMRASLGFGSARPAGRMPLLLSLEVDRVTLEKFKILNSL